MIRTPSGEFKDIAICTEAGEVPGEQVALMDTTEIFRFKPVSKHARLEIVHVLVNCCYTGWHKRVEKEEIEISQQIKTLLGDVDVRIGSESDPGFPGLEEQTTGVCRGVPDHKRSYGNAEEAEGFVRPDDLPFKCKKPEDLRAIIHDWLGGKYRRDLLDAVKIPKSHEVIIVSMCPDNRVDVRRSVFQELLAEIRRRIYQQVKALIFNKEGCPQAHRAGRLRIGTLGAGAPDLRRTDCITGSKEGNPHAYNQFRCRIASLFFTIWMPFSISSALILSLLSMSAERIASLTIMRISDPENPSVWAARRW